MYFGVCMLLYILLLAMIVNVIHVHFAIPKVCYKIHAPPICTHDISCVYANSPCTLLYPNATNF